MRWQAGVVMEIRGQYAILMTPEGEFKKVRLKGRRPDIGEEIRIPVERRLSFHVQKAGWLAVAAAIIVLMVASPLLTIINSPPEVAYAYVSIDINPSLELTVSNYYNVMAAQAYNADGQKVLNGLNLKGVAVKNAVALINNKAKQLGYLGKSKDNTIVLSYAFIPDVKTTKSLDGATLMAMANEGIGENKTESKVQTIKVPADIRDAAKKKGISPAKYAVLIEAVNSGLPVTEKDMKENSIKVAIASAGGEPEAIIDKAHKEESFDEKEQRYYAILSERARATDGENKDPEETTSASNDNGQGTSAANSGNNGGGNSGHSGDQTGKPSTSVTGSGNNGNASTGGSKPDVKDPDPNSNSGTPGTNPNGSGTQTGGTAGGSNQGDPVIDPVDGTTDPDDTTTEDNYMGTENSGRSSNDKSNMNVIKPNF